MTRRHLELSYMRSPILSRKYMFVPEVLLSSLCFRLLPHHQQTTSKLQRVDQDCPGLCQASIRLQTFFPRIQRAPRSMMKTGRALQPGATTSYIHVTMTTGAAGAGALVIVQPLFGEYCVHSRGFFHTRTSSNMTARYQVWGQSAMKRSGRMAEFSSITHPAKCLLTVDVSVRQQASVAAPFVGGGFLGAFVASRSPAVGQVVCSAVQAHAPSGLRLACNGSRNEGTCRSGKPPVDCSMLG